jgi:hypothetical protein
MPVFDKDIKKSKRAYLGLAVNQASASFSVD